MEAAASFSVTGSSLNLLEFGEELLGRPGPPSGPEHRRVGGGGAVQRARQRGPALEALAVIAYRQPVTRAQVEAVRGVDCAGVLRSLLQRGLVEEVGQ